MLVNSFDTKYSQTANKYESLDNSFMQIVGANKKFSSKTIPIGQSDSRSVY